MKNYLSIIFLTVLGFSVKAQKLSIGQPYQVTPIPSLGAANKTASTF